MAADAPAQGDMTLLEHLDELRRRIVRVALAVVLGTVVGYVVFPQLLDLLIAPYCSIRAERLAVDECNLLMLRPLEGFSVRVKVAMLCGTFLGGPVIFWQLWRFVVPGLTRRERRMAAPFVFVSQVLFGLGIAFAWFVLPNALGVLTSLGGERIEAALTAEEYISFVLSTSLAFGVVFLLPVLLTSLSLAGILTARAMRTARPYAIVGIALLAALITPTTDPVTMLLMMFPMVVFYEVSIGFAWLFERRRRRAVAP